MEYVVCNTITHTQAVVWNIRHCKLKQQLSGHAGAVFAVDLDEKAKLAYTGSGDKVNTVHVVYVRIMEYCLDNQTMGDSHRSLHKNYQSQQN